MDISSWPTTFPRLLPGILVSFELLLFIIVIGSILAFALAVGQRSQRKVVQLLRITLMEFARGVPALVLLYLVYFGFPSTGLSLSAFVAAGVALSINFAGYTCDVIRSGIRAVPSGQLEAADALGLSRAVTMRRVVLPQAVRIITPPMLSWVIVYFQTTSVAFVIAVPELMSAAYSVAAGNFQYLSTFVLAGLLYAGVSIPGSQLVSFLERRQHAGAP